MPVQIFNEKAVCGLGRGLALSGRLNPDGVAMATDALRRFRALLAAMKVDDAAAIATAAVRDAEDGADFLKAVEALAGLKPRLISGKEEARLSALGVRSGIPDAAGIMGDMGGGSLELVTLSENGGVGPQISLPVGPLRLLGLEQKGRQLDDLIDREFERVPWLRSAEARPLYIVGGAWRAIAKAHMVHSAHPLHIIHHYRVPTARGVEFAKLLSKQSPESLARMPGISSRRVDAVPLASRILARLLQIMRPSEIIFSAFGLREGLVYDRLDPEDKKRDPLIEYCRREAARSGRFGDATRLDGWLAGVFEDVSPAEARLREAVCLLSDIGWPYHPDYRGDQATLQIMRMPTGGISHEDRAFLATAMAARYGDKSPVDRYDLRRLLTPEAGQRAFTIGVALRLAYSMTGGALELLSDCSLARSGKTLEIGLDGAPHLIRGEVIDRRVGALAKALGLDGWRAV